MNVLSLFDGMSCGMIALERAGIKVDRYFACEIDKWAIQVSKKNYPFIHQLGDVSQVSFPDSFGPVARGRQMKIDLLIGGSPCQAFSNAGKGEGFDDPRGKLFWEYVRLLRETKPKYFLLENVVMKQEHQDVISEALGVQPVMINSADFSAQNRKRLYWTNIPIKPWDAKGIKLADIIEDGVVDRDKSYCLDANYFKGGNLKQYFEKHRRQLVFLEGNADDYRKLTPLECERLQTVPDNYTDGVSNTQRYKMIGNGWTVDVIAHILGGIK